MHNPNPFYSNHVFSMADMARNRITWRDKLRLIFHPMLCQINDGYVFYFKITKRGEYYLFDIKKLGED